MTTLQKRREDVIGAVTQHLADVGSRDWIKVRSSFPGVPPATFWRCVKRAKFLLSKRPVERLPEYQAFIKALAARQLAKEAEDTGRARGPSLRAHRRDVGQQAHVVHELQQRAAEVKVDRSPGRDRSRRRHSDCETLRGV